MKKSEEPYASKAVNELKFNESHVEWKPLSLSLSLFFFWWWNDSFSFFFFIHSFVLEKTSVSIEFNFFSHPIVSGFIGKFPCCVTTSMFVTSFQTHCSTATESSSIVLNYHESIEKCNYTNWSGCNAEVLALFLFSSSHNVVRGIVLNNKRKK